MKNVLFIGGAGFIGSSLVHRFLKENIYQIFILEPERSNIVRLDDISDQIEIVRTDIKDLVTLYNCLKSNSIDTIIHLASNLIPSSSLYAYQNEISDLIIPTLSVLKMASELGIKFVYFSSGGTIYGNRNSGVFGETDKLEPISYYGMSKLMIEEAILYERRTKNLQYLILRPSNPYGPGQNLNGRQGLIAVSLGKIINNEPVEIWGDGTIIRDYIYIDDLTEIVLRLLKKGVEGQILNVGSGIGYSVNEVIDLLKEHVSSPFEVIYKDGREVDVSSMILDVKKLSMFCPYRPLPLDEGIKKYIKKLYK